MRFRLWRHRGDEDVARDVRDELQFHREESARDEDRPPAAAAGGDADRPSREQRRFIERRLAGPTADAAHQARLIRLALDRDRRLRWTDRLDSWRLDAVDAARRLRRAPGFTGATMAVIALGLGASAAMFSLLQTVFFRPLPFRDGARIVRVQEYQRSLGGARQWYDTSTVTLEATRANPAVAVASALRPLAGHLLTDGGAEHVAVGAVTAGWAEVLGVAPARGRFFTADEEAAGTDARVVVISDRFWRSHFAGRDDAVGRTLVFDGGGRTIIGVLPAGINFPYEEDAWWPMRPGPNERGFFLWARLRPHAGLSDANVAFDAIAPSLLHDYPQIMRGLRPAARPLREVLVDDDGRVVVSLGAAVAVLLLIVSANVAMLLMTRLASRQTELAVRAALGCGRVRQLRQLAIESVLLFLGGGAVGLAAARLAAAPMRALIPTRLAAQAGLSDLSMGWTVAAFVAGLAGINGLCVGLAAARRAGRDDLSATLRQSTRTGTSLDGRRTLGALVVVELALAAALVTAAVTLEVAVAQLEDRSVGFPTANLLTFHMDFETARLSVAGVRADIADRLGAVLARLPGVARVGMATVNPLCCGDWAARLDIEGRPATLEEAPMISHSLVFPGFFDALGIPILQGRPFDARDRVGAAPAVIIDERLARAFFPNESPLGKRIRRATRDNSSTWMTIVGVAGAVEDPGEYGASWYLPFLQDPSGASSNELHVWMRAANAAAIAPQVRAAVAAVDRMLTPIDLRTMDEIRSTSLGQSRVGGTVAALFGLAGALLALIGVYGLVAFVVARGEREAGIRIALGATPSRICIAIVGRLVRLGAIGIGAGLLAARLADPWLLAAVRRGADPALHGAFIAEAPAVAAVLLAAVALSASAGARRILGVNPARAIGQ